MKTAVENNGMATKRDLDETTMGGVPTPLPHCTGAIVLGHIFGTRPNGAENVHGRPSVGRDDEISLRTTDSKSVRATRYSNSPYIVVVATPGRLLELATSSRPTHFPWTKPIVS